MGIFRLGKKKEFVDLTKFRKQESVEKKAPSQDTDLDFLGNLASASSSDSQSDFNVIDNERKRKLTKRFMEITNRIEELSNQLYHLQQRVELLERKVGLKSFE